MTVLDSDERLVEIELTPLEEQEAQRLQLMALEANSEAQVREVLLLGLAAYVGYVKRHALASAVGKIRDVQQISLTADILMMAYSPYWNSYVKPLFKSYIFFRQSMQAKAMMPNDMVMALAEDYSKRLHGYFTTTSAEAMTKGFNAYVNKRVPARLAAEKVFGAFGLTQRQMATFVATDTAKAEAVTSTRPLDVRARVKGWLARALDDRLLGIAEHEAFVMSEEAKQVGWLYQQSRGFIPAGATKMWMTARDERVCGVCGPMHKQEVPLGEHFVLPSKVKVWTTGVHPKCRCRMVLRTRTTEVFGKAEQYKRDRSGRFAEVNTLSAAQRAQDEQTAMIRRALVAPPVEQVAPGLVARPSLTGAPTLKAKPSLTGKPSLQGKKDVPLKGKEQARELSAGERDSKLTSSGPRLARLAATRSRMAELHAERVESMLQSKSVGLDQKKITRATSQGTRPTIPLSGYIYGEPESGMEFFGDDVDDQIVITRDDMFSPIMDIGSSIYQGRMEEISNWTDDIAGDEDRVLYPEVVDGVVVTAELDWADVETTLHLTSMGFPGTREFGQDPTIPLEFFDSDGRHVVEREVLVRDIAHHLGVSADMFVTRIFRTKEVHMDASMESGSLHGYEAWNIAGNYKAVSMGIDYDEFGTPVEIIELTPIVDGDD